MEFPVVQTGITFQELPNMVSFYIQFGNCTIKCNGCHSSYLWEGVNSVKYIELSNLIDKVYKAKLNGADAIILFGDINNRINIASYKELCIKLSELLPICVYSGADSLENSLGDLDILNYITWIKLGHYDSKYGGLNSLTTNQHMYLISNGDLIDITKNLFIKE